MVGLDLAEINPLLDPKELEEKMYGDNKDIEGTKTIALGCNLILSILGKKD